MFFCIDDEIQLIIEFIRSLLLHLFLAFGLILINLLDEMLLVYILHLMPFIFIARFLDDWTWDIIFALFSLLLPSLSCERDLLL